MQNELNNTKEKLKCYDKKLDKVRTHPSGSLIEVVYGLAVVFYFFICLIRFAFKFYNTFVYAFKFLILILIIGALFFGVKLLVSAFSNTIFMIFLHLN